MNTQRQNSLQTFPQERLFAQVGADSTLAFSRGQNPSVRDSLATSGWLLGLNGVHIGEDMRLYPGPNSIGSSARCDVVVTAPETGRQHAVLDVLSGESAIIFPGSSQRPLYVNDEICEKATPVCDGDVIQTGDQYFAFVSLLPLPSNDRRTICFRERLNPKTPCTIGWLVEVNSARAGRDFRLFAGENRIGSQKGLEIFIPEQSVKERHCVITRHTENWTIVPLSVTDQLYVNGVPTTGTGLENGDIINIAGTEFMFRCLKVAFAR
ncbi:MAG: FHA domain-containing protein [Proteobacteria bacterium]|nr:FHA domain-containing protein [Pseudomonadota bacterium]